MPVMAYNKLQNYCRLVFERLSLGLIASVLFPLKSFYKEKHA